MNRRNFLKSVGIAAGTALSRRAPGAGKRLTRTDTQHKFFDRQLAIYEFAYVRPNMGTQGRELGLDDIVAYKFNAIRVCIATPKDVWNGGECSEGCWNTLRYATAKIGHKFDLNKPDKEWLQALSKWGKECEKRGVHTIIDLFDGCNVKHHSTKCNDPFYGALNVNDVIQADGDIRDKMFSVWEPLLDYQKKRIDMVCGSLLGLKNVIIEIANEASGRQVVDWRRKMIEHILPRYAVRLCTNPGWNESDEFKLDYVSIHNHRMNLNAALKAIAELNPNGRDKLPGKVIISSDAPGWDDTSKLYDFIFNVFRAGGSFALCPYQSNWQKRLEITKRAIIDSGVHGKPSA